MSAFLGPIHYWLYNKVMLQEQLIQEILKASSEKQWNPALEETVDTAYGKADNRSLESIIDQTNIHGWLQEKITQSELRLAFLVTKILEEDQGRMAELKQIAYDFGQAHPVSEGMSADDAYKVLNDSLLDGMPCDRVNEIQETGKEQVKWRQNSCVHQDYWDQVDGDIAVYYELRNEIIEGMLSNSNLTYIVKDNREYAIEKR